MLSGCNAARQALTDAEHERDDAQLYELMDSEKALYDIEHDYRTFHGWAVVRQARQEVRCSEARRDGVESALAACLGNAKRKAAAHN